jgi:hypothetical protein
MTGPTGVSGDPIVTRIVAQIGPSGAIPQNTPTVLIYNTGIPSLSPSFSQVNDIWLGGLIATNSTTTVQQISLVYAYIDQFGPAVGPFLTTFRVFLEFYSTGLPPVDEPTWNLTLYYAPVVP